jgi:hypothetical protein
MTDIFISYASDDRPRVKTLVDALQQKGWSVWWDRTILAGKTFDRVIEAALKDSRCVIVLWSGASVESDWVWTEADEGRRRGILVPAMLDDVEIPFAFRRIHTANLIGWSGGSPGDQFDELARAVSDVLSNTITAHPHSRQQQSKQSNQQIHLEEPSSSNYDPTYYSPQRRAERADKADLNAPLAHASTEGKDREHLQTIDDVVLAVSLFSEYHTGALIVIERKVGLQTFIETGVPTDAQVSYDLLSTIFRPSSPLHDGAVILQGGRIAAAACFLPLTMNPVLSTQFGTRHRAAIGITEETDAIAIVVSEETGGISVADAGKIERDLDVETLRQRLRAFPRSAGTEVRRRQH